MDHGMSRNLCSTTLVIGWILHTTSTYAKSMNRIGIWIE